VKIRVASAIARMLEAAQTPYCFGYNGHGNWALLDALVYETKVPTIAARAEDHAVHMADCYWRTARKPPMAVVATSVGPGNANIVPALCSAFFESSALMVLAGAGPTQWVERGGIEEFYRYGPEEWPQSLKLMTKKSVMVNRPDTALEMVMRAYKTAVTGRPGPVVVMLPFDVQHTEIELDAIPDLTQWTTVSKPAPDPEAIGRAADLISTATRPVITVSSGIHNSRAWAELRGVAEKFNIPVETTTPGKGALPEDHPMSLGVGGRAGTAHANDAARRCDVLIGIGTRFGDFDTGAWTLHSIGNGTKLIHIDIDDGELSRVYPTDIAIQADARLALNALDDALSQRPQANRSEWLQELGEVRESFEAEIAPQRTSDSTPMGYAPVFSAVSDLIEKEAPLANVLFDTGHALSFGPVFLKALSNNYIHSGFFHRMGSSIPGGIGAALARPEVPTVVLVGDGSFVMTGSALLTAVEQQIPLVVVVLNNATLQIERELMHKFYGRTALTDYVRTDTGEPHNPDFVAWAKSMGALGVRVEKQQQVREAVSEALKAKLPTVIDVPIDPDDPGYRAIHYKYPSDYADPILPAESGRLPIGGRIPAP
jgi:acetolactate synthase-1/2/3 large subunit